MLERALPALALGIAHLADPAVLQNGQDREQDQRGPDQQRQPRGGRRKGSVTDGSLAPPKREYSPEKPGIYKLNNIFAPP